MSNIHQTQIDKKSSGNIDRLIGFHFMIHSSPIKYVKGVVNKYEIMLKIIEQRPTKVNHLK